MEIVREKKTFDPKGSVVLHRLPGGYSKIRVHIRGSVKSNRTRLRQFRSAMPYVKYRSFNQTKNHQERTILEIIGKKVAVDTLILPLAFHLLPVEFITCERIVSPESLLTS